MATSATAWHYALGAEQKGPVSVDELRTLVAVGVVGNETLVWSPALTDWQPLRATELAAAMGLVGSRPAAPAQSDPVRQPGPSMGAPVGFVACVKRCFAQYATFQGRARRPELWYFLLFGLLLGLATGVVDLVLFGAEIAVSPISTIVSLALLVPGLAVAVRRLHDTDRTGWWYLIIFLPVVGVIVLIVFWCQAGTAGRNRFG